MPELETVDIKEHPRYWITRDEDANGALSEDVDVWLEAPIRINLPDRKGCRWEGRDDSGLEHHYAQWSLANCRKQCHTVPDTSRECLVVG